MDTLKKENWETLKMNAPAGFVVYFLKRQDWVKSALGNLNIEIDNFRRLNDRGFTFKVKDADCGKKFLDNMQTSFFGQLPAKLPQVTKSFIDISFD